MGFTRTSQSRRNLVGHLKSSGLAGLADGAMRQTEAVDNNLLVNRFLDIFVAGKLTTGTSPTVNSVVKIYAFGSIDNGARFTGGAGAAEAAFTGQEEQLFLLGQVVVDATSDKGYNWGPFSIRDAFRSLFVPDRWGLIFKNETGVAFNASAANFDIDFQGMNVESVSN